MATHPSGETVKIVGIEVGNRGQSCKEHNICGSVLQLDSVVRFRKVQIVVEGKEESAIAVFWVSDGIDRCRVRYLLRHHLKHWTKYKGVLAQVIKIFNSETTSPAKRHKRHKNRGCAVAALISFSPVKTGDSSSGSCKRPAAAITTTTGTLPRRNKKASTEEQKTEDKEDN